MIENGLLGRLPVFPLPDTVFFPGTQLPLHVFEPRYRDMVEHCLSEGHCTMGVALLQPGYEEAYADRPPVYEVMGAGVIVDYERFPDGRYNILLKGTDRVRALEELAPRESYRVMRVERLEDHCSKIASDCEGTLRSLALRLAQSVPSVREPLTRLIHGTHGGHLADQLACRLVPEAARRQRILEERDVCRRVELVMEAIAEVCLRIDPSCSSSGHVN